MLMSFTKHMIIIIIIIIIIIMIIFIHNFFSFIERRVKPN